jgi:hypothetical protein
MFPLTPLKVDMANARNNIHNFVSLLNKLRSNLYLIKTPINKKNQIEKGNFHASEKAKEVNQNCIPHKINTTNQIIYLIPTIH